MYSLSTCYCYLFVFFCSFICIVHSYANLISSDFYLFIASYFQIAVDEKDSILASLPTNLKEKGSTLYASLIDGKVRVCPYEERNFMRRLPAQYFISCFSQNSYIASRITVWVDQLSKQKFLLSITNIWISFFEVGVPLATQHSQTLEPNYWTVKRLFNCLWISGMWYNTWYFQFPNCPEERKLEKER